ncbi:MAG: alpha/beta fold hydrolase [Spirochaetales bacterium]|nr:alpha/beta fold hydrolase [Leptospiraceae bacterium]MCP5483110.1 alpha/beta fold hydrolase [Spirochaetales bacterium]MCP5484550.1 alpha/beta fold hydrolase [Spirochaetales bacterium]
MHKWIKNRWIGWTSIALALPVLSIAAIAFYFSGRIMYPPAFTCPPDRYVYCSTPAELGLRFENVDFAAADGVALRGWYIPAPGSSASIAVVHGRGVDRTEGLRYVLSLHRAGFNLLLFDLRNSGTSDASFNSMGYYEQRDVTAAVDYLLGVRGARHVGVLGFSMGAATSILATASDPRIEAGVYESGFASLREILDYRAERDFDWLPRSLILPVVVFVFELRTGADADDISPAREIARIARRPILIIHGDADASVPVEHAEELFEAAGAGRSLWIIHEGGHASSWNDARSAAEYRIPHFFLKAFRGD